MPPKRISDDVSVKFSEALINKNKKVSGHCVWRNVLTSSVTVEEEEKEEEEKKKKKKKRVRGSLSLDKYNPLIEKSAFTTG